MIFFRIFLIIFSLTIASNAFSAPSFFDSYHSNGVTIKPTKNWGHTKIYPEIESDFRVSLWVKDDAKNSNWWIELKTKKSKIKFKFNAEDLKQASYLLSPTVTDNLIEVRGSAGAPTIQIISVIQGRLVAELKSYIGPKKKPPRYCAVQDVLKKDPSILQECLSLGQHELTFLNKAKDAMVWLLIENPKRRTAGCTGFFISPELILTNRHCISDRKKPLPKHFCHYSPGKKPTMIRAWRVGYKNVRHNSPDYQCLSLVASSEVRDSRKYDFAILRIPKNSMQPASHLPLDVSISSDLNTKKLLNNQISDNKSTRLKRREGTRLALLQYPGVSPLTINLDETCSVWQLSLTKTFLRHGCDSESGSSGSPVISWHNQKAVIGLHFYGYKNEICNKETKCSGNGSLPIEALLLYLKKKSPETYKEIHQKGTIITNTLQTEIERT